MLFRPIVQIVLGLLYLGHLATGYDCISHGSDCRVPFGLDMAYGTLFSPACHRHSVCYSCGAQYGLSKTDCDAGLRTGMNAACATLEDPSICSFQANNVFALRTRVIGTNFFHDKFHPAAFCIEHGITDCLPLNQTSSAAGHTGK